jgi:diamine N-acetyltransferase
MVPIEENPRQPVVNIAGDKVALGPLDRDLMLLYHRWDNDFGVLFLEEALASPSTLESTQRTYDRISTDPHCAYFTIYERTTLRPIGRTALSEIDHVHGTATFSIAIGDRTSWGQGYGTEATRLMVDYAFVGLGLHNVMLFVYSHNERAIRTYRRVGFREIGRRREAVRLSGQRYDVIYLDFLASEFQKSALRSLMPIK